MPTKRRLFPTLRAVARAARNLGRCADALERLADHAEGRMRMREAGADAPDDLTVSYADPELLARMEREADRLTPLLGRPPTVDELDQVLEGREVGPEEIAAHRARVAAEVRAQLGRRD